MLLECDVVFFILTPIPFQKLQLTQLTTRLHVTLMSGRRNEWATQCISVSGSCSSVITTSCIRERQRWSGILAFKIYGFRSVKRPHNPDNRPCLSTTLMHIGYMYLNDQCASISQNTYTTHFIRRSFSKKAVHGQRNLPYFCNKIRCKKGSTRIYNVKKKATSDGWLTAAVVYNRNF